MGAHATHDGRVTVTTMTEKGQVTIPRAVRDAAGMRPGMPVEVRVENGEAVVRSAEPRVLRERREGDMRRRIAAFRAAHRPIAVGMTTDAIMATIREPVPE